MPPLLRGQLLLPFLIVTLIWSSTWIVIRDSLGVVPPAWSVTYRFAVAALGMAVVARMSGVSLAISGRGLMFAGLLGLAQFCGNFNLLYVAEAHLTSGLCALVYALLMIPNSLFAWLFLGHRLSRSFMIGSVIAVLGVALLFAHEYQASVNLPAQEVMIGLGLCLVAVLFASMANVMQAAPFAQRIPVLTMLSWAMAIGAAGDALLAWIMTGPPVFEARPSYWFGTLYLALAGSVITFPLYFRLIREIGAGPAAYTSVLIPILAMGISTLIEDYRWSPAALIGVLLALGGLVIALQARFRQAGG